MGFVNQSKYSSFLILIMTLISSSLVSTRGQISLDQQVPLDGFYSLACPLMESIIKTTVSAYFQLDQSIAPGLLKLFINDCFVEGCDGSVLMSGLNTEKTAEANVNLRGFEIIEDIKKQLEILCPGIISCADILALAARDSVLLTDGPSWEVKLGRKDGLISLESNVANLPFLSDSITVVLNNFAAFGFNTEEFVALIGGHTIGSARCSSVTKWIYNTSIGSNSSFPTIDQRFFEELNKSCPDSDGDGSNHVPLDFGSEFTFDTSIFENILKGQSVVKIDRSLLNIPEIYHMLNQFTTTTRFQAVFTRVMAKVSAMGWKTGVNGEIRTNCSAPN